MTDTAPVQRPPEPLTQPQEASIGSLIADASRDLSTLVQHEIALVKQEVGVTVKNGGLGAAFFAAAGFVLVLGIVMLSVALAHFLSMTGLHLAWCYLLVFLLYLVLAGVLGFLGYRKVRSVGPPERAIAQAQETKKTLTGRGGSEG